MKKTYDILKLISIHQFSELLGIEYFKLITIAFNPNYYTFKIPKKNGNLRLILAPNEALKKIQRKINYILQDLYTGMDLGCVYGFNSSQPEHIKANAQKHINKKWVYNTDLKDFFPNITSVMVRDLFMTAPFNFNEGLATLIAMLTTYDNTLPTGAPSSPIISNLIFYKTDKKLQVLAKKFNLSYSRYADDLSFSSDINYNQNIIVEINQIIEKDNFVINHKKERLQNYYNRQTVTGITVNMKVNIK